MKSPFKILGLILSLSMLLAACAPAATQAPVPTEPPAATQQPTQPPAATQPPTQPPAPTEPPAATETTAPFTYDYGTIVGPAGGYLERALAGEFSGKTVTVDGTQTDPDDRKMMTGWTAFEDATGITVDYIGNKEFEARISIAVDAGQAPEH